MFKLCHDTSKPSIFFSSLAQSLAVSQTQEAVYHVWTVALKSALERLYSYTRARPPSRTMVDPLDAFVNTLLDKNFSSAVRAAGEAAEQTKNLEAKAGRSAYVGTEFLQKEQVPDPGAWGVKLILESFIQA